MPAATALARPPRTVTAPPPTFTIGELAREFGVTTRAIRFYEDCGLLEPERAGRQRVYSVRDRTRLKLTLRGKRLGLKLAEVRELVDMYESRRDTGPAAAPLPRCAGAPSQPARAAPGRPADHAR